MSGIITLILFPFRLAYLLVYLTLRLLAHPGVLILGCIGAIWLTAVAGGGGFAAFFGCVGVGFVNRVATNMLAIARPPSRRQRARARTVTVAPSLARMVVRPHGAGPDLREAQRAMPAHLQQLLARKPPLRLVG